jgi:hypothetical protein
MMNAGLSSLMSGFRVLSFIVVMYQVIGADVHVRVFLLSVS